MENHSYFYQAVTKIAEARIKELMLHAQDAEAGGHVFPEAGSYYRACARVVYSAWHDITEGWQVCEDVKRLESITGPALWTEFALLGNSRPESL